MIVSVLMPTYNHERTVAKAIDSFLAQSINSNGIEAELIISDDFSTDKTAEICAKYSSKYPDRIKYYRQEKNLGLIANYAFLLGKTDAKYIAILESDDYWTHPRKIDMQVSIMEKNPDCGLVYTTCTYKPQKSAVENSAIDQNSEMTGNIAEDFQINIIRYPQMFKELIKSNKIPAVTVLFRRSLYEKYCNINDYLINKFVTFDYPVWLTLASVSDFCFLNINTAVYSIGSESISNNGSYEKRLQFQNGIDAIVDYICARFLNKDMTLRVEDIHNERIVKHMLVELQFGRKKEFYRLAGTLCGCRIKWLLIRMFPWAFMIKKRKYLAGK